MRLKASAAAKPPLHPLSASRSVTRRLNSRTSGCSRSSTASDRRCPSSSATGSGAPRAPRASRRRSASRPRDDPARRLRTTAAVVGRWGRSSSSGKKRGSRRGDDAVGHEEAGVAVVRVQAVALPRVVTEDHIGPDPADAGRDLETLAEPGLELAVGPAEEDHLAFASERHGQRPAARCAALRRARPGRVQGPRSPWTRRCRRGGRSRSRWLPISRACRRSRTRRRQGALRRRAPGWGSAGWIPSGQVATLTSARSSGRSMSIREPAVVDDLARQSEPSRFCAVALEAPRPIRETESRARWALRPHSSRRGGGRARVSRCRPRRASPGRRRKEDPRGLRLRGRRLRRRAGRHLP